MSSVPRLPDGPLFGERNQLTMNIVKSLETAVREIESLLAALRRSTSSSRALRQRTVALSSAAPRWLRLLVQPVLPVYPQFVPR